MPRIPNKKLTMLSLDTETTGLDLHHGARPFLVTFCDDLGVNLWYEWSVDPLTRNVTIRDVQDLFNIQKLIDNADILILQNAKFDYAGLRLLFQDHGLELHWDWGKVKDTLLAGHLLASNHPHDLTSMAMEYLSADVQPYEDGMEEAVKEAKQLVQQASSKSKKEIVGQGHLFEDGSIDQWRVAKKGLPEMPSAKEKVWKYDCWLPKQLAEELNYPADHPWRTVTAEYANSDSTTTLALWKRQEKLIKERGLQKIYDARMKLPAAISATEWKGMTVSKSRFEELYNRLVEEADDLHQRCLRLADHEIESLPVNGCSNSLKHVLFEKFKLTSPKKTPKGMPSTDKFVLDHWLATLPQRSRPLLFVQSLRGYRRRKTAIGYLESYRKYWLPTDDPDTMVIYSSLNPTGTDTLRFSSENPNEQQISKQEDVNLRYIFGPGPGREWWALDYENIELRIPAYESNEKVMIDLFEKPNDPPYFGSYHLMNASIIYPDLFWPLAEKKGEFKQRYASTWYQWCKNFGFACQYGAVIGSGTADRAAHKPGAQDLVAARLTEHSKLTKRMTDQANKQGYVETLPDKTVDPKKGYPLLCTRSRWGGVTPTVPLSYHVQGTAMWCTMKAMIRVSNYFGELNSQPNSLGYYMVSQIHDEIVIDLPSGGKSNLPIVSKVKELMEQSGDDIGVPLRASISYHPSNWAVTESI